MADESLFTLQDAFALAKARAVDAFCIKLYKLGGISAARKIGAVVAAFKRHFAPDDASPEMTEQDRALLHCLVARKQQL